MSEMVEAAARSLHARGGIGLSWQELPDVLKAAFRAMAQDDCRQPRAVPRPPAIRDEPKSLTRVPPPCQPLKADTTP